MPAYRSVHSRAETICDSARYQQAPFAGSLGLKELSGPKRTPRKISVVPFAVDCMQPNRDTNSPAGCGVPLRKSRLVTVTRTSLMCED